MLTLVYWQHREGLIQELRGSIYSLLDAFKGDCTQQAAHHEQRMRQLQDQLSAGFQEQAPDQRLGVHPCHVTLLLVLDQPLVIASRNSTTATVRDWR